MEEEVADSGNKCFIIVFDDDEVYSASLFLLPAQFSAKDSFTVALMTGEIEFSSKFKQLSTDSDAIVDVDVVFKDTDGDDCDGKMLWKQFLLWLKTIMLWFLMMVVLTTKTLSFFLIFYIFENL